MVTGESDGSFTVSSGGAPDVVLGRMREDDLDVWHAWVQLPDGELQKLGTFEGYSDAEAAIANAAG